MISLSKIKFNTKLLKEQGVGLVLLFGSQTGRFVHPKSDIDIGIVFYDKTKMRNDPVGVYGSLYEELSLKFKNKSIDLVYIEETSLHLQYKAITGGKILYEQSLGFTANYKERVLNKYFDFRFYENIFRRALLQEV